MSSLPQPWHMCQCGPAGLWLTWSWLSGGWASQQHWQPSADTSTTGEMWGLCGDWVEERAEESEGLDAVQGARRMLVHCIAGLICVMLHCRLLLLRLVSCRLYKEVVDELLAEVAAEVMTSAAAADAFSSDMLVAAVAFSTGK